MCKKIILLVLLLLVGCGSGFDQTSQAAIYQGKQAVTVEFLENAPPNSVKENIPFPVIVELKNNGAEDVDEGKFILGVQRDLFRIDNQEGKSREIVDLNVMHGRKASIGQTHRHQFSVTSGEGKLQNTPGTLLYFLIYPYKTVLKLTNVCIDPDIFGEVVIEKPCEARDSYSLGSGQGAPVAITRVDVELEPTADGKVKPLFTLEVSNEQRGRVIDVNRWQEFAQSQGSGGAINDQNFFDRYEITATFNGQRLTCPALGAPGSFTLFPTGPNPITTVVCKTDSITFERSQTSFLGELNVELRYAYFETGIKQVTVEKQRLA